MQYFSEIVHDTLKRFGEILFGKHVERYRCQVCKMANRHAVVAACASIIIRLIVKKRKRRRRNRTIWVREWIKNREVRDAYNSLMEELRLTDVGDYGFSSPSNILDQMSRLRATILCCDQARHVIS